MTNEMKPIKCSECGSVRLYCNIPTQLNPPECYWCSKGLEKPKITYFSGTYSVEDKQDED